MRAQLVPVYFSEEKNGDFLRQLEAIRILLETEADFLEPVRIGEVIPPADAVVFPQLIGEAYRKIEEVKKISLPILVITSEFATVAMWDWEIVTYFKDRGVKPFTPYSLEITRTICRALALKKELKNTKFLLFQDNPGDGMQAEIFKRFYWWESECNKLISEKFGITFIKKSYKELCITAQSLSDTAAAAVWEKWSFKTEGVPKDSVLRAVKLYMAVKEIVDADDTIKGVGANCLNESFYSDTTPCLAWNMLYEEKGLMWACEADTMSLITEHLIHKSLGVPVMTSNVYPFLMGMAALKHEKIKEFPKVEDSDRHMLIVHCGYTGLMPREMCAEWTLKPKVLEIVNDHAVAVDSRMPVGEITLAKIHPSLSRMLVIEGDLEKYAEYPGSDCRTGALVKIKDGRKIMEDLYSHHDIALCGHRAAELKVVAEVFDMISEEI